MNSAVNDSHFAAKRMGCCAGWPKPCPYHEGYTDGYERFADVIAGMRAMRDELEALFKDAWETDTYDESDWATAVGGILNGVYPLTGGKS